MFWEREEFERRKRKQLRKVSREALLAVASLPRHIRSKNKRIVITKIVFFGEGINFLPQRLKDAKCTYNLCALAS